MTTLLKTTDLNKQQKNSKFFLSVGVNRYLNTKATLDTPHLIRIRFGVYKGLEKIIVGNFTLPLLTKSLDPGEPDINSQPGCQI